MAVAVKFNVKNVSGPRRRTEIKLAINGGATKSVKPWNAAYSPGEYDNARAIDRSRNAVLCKSKHTEAFVLQGSSPAPTELLPSWIVYRFELAPNETKSFTFVNSLGESQAFVEKHYDAIVNNFEAVLRQTTDEWNAELKAAFTPHDPTFGLRHDVRHADAALLGNDDFFVGHFLERDAAFDARSLDFAPYDGNVDDARRLQAFRYGIFNRRGRRAVVFGQ
jgi:hypothetical protein